MSTLIASNDNYEDTTGREPGEWTLPFLQKAARGKLMPAGEHNNAAARTLARLWTSFSGEDRPGYSWLGAPEDFYTGEGSKDDGNPKPNLPGVQCELVSVVTVEKLAASEIRTLKTEWRNKATGAVHTVYRTQVRIAGKWWDYDDYFGRSRESIPKENSNRYAFPPPVAANNNDLRPLDPEDKSLFRTLVGEDVMNTIELMNEGAGAKGIGEAFGYKHKPAEAVGLDRVRAAVKAAQKAFADIAQAAKVNYWWQSPLACKMYFMGLNKAA